MSRLVVVCLFGAVTLGSFARADEKGYAPAAQAPTAQAAVTQAPAPDPAPQPAVAAIPDLSGEWCGNWSSCVNGHNGPMRASFCRLTDGNYQVTFVGRFAKLIPFRYTTTLTVTSHKDGVVYLSGSHYLGPIMGCYTYNAWSNGCQFVSGYSSAKDQGQFSLVKQ